LLHRLIEGVNADAPTLSDVQRVRQELVEAVTDSRGGAPNLSNRLSNVQARQTRAASILVRQRLAEQWNDS
jgi:hypothetical protein